MYVDHRLLDLLPKKPCKTTTLIVTGGPLPPSFQTNNFQRVTMLSDVMAEGSIQLTAKVRLERSDSKSIISPSYIANNLLLVISLLALPLIAAAVQPLPHKLPEISHPLNLLLPDNIPST